MTDNGQYDVNLFKATTPHARANRNLIISLALIWAMAVFGFQFLLIILNEETPEPSYTTYQAVWPAVLGTATASFEQRQDFSRSILSVLGKRNTVIPAHRAVLTELLSWNIYMMLPDSSKAAMTVEPTKATFGIAAETIGLVPTGLDQLMVELLPSSIQKVESTELNPTIKETLPGIMKLYLVHNQSVLTDFRFLGFPFHYWYTAQFLLILFVILCVVYAKRLEQINSDNNFVERS